jgi:7-dehydrocholesterol reductase
MSSTPPPAGDQGSAGTSSPREPSALRRIIVPLLLMLGCPPAVIVVWMIAAHFDGSVLAFFRDIDWQTFWRLCPRPTWEAARMILIFAVMEGLLLVLLPGKIHHGPVTPAGNRPRYRENGLAAWVATHAILLLAAYPLGLFRLGEIYDNLGSILVVCNVLALVLCGALYVKGVNAPSSSDNGRSGNLIFDYFWGVELHPTAFGESLKQYVNCRLSMMGWSVIVISCAAKQYETTGKISNTMMVTAALQVVYLLKFFRWETGYFGSLDIMHDRFGFYIFWGVAAWVPAVYTLVSQYQVQHPVDLPWWMAAGILTFGLLSIWANYDADAQRQRVRETGGNTTVWGKPPETMTAKYVTADGKERESLLLLSGWWGLSRHFHYVAEIGLALAWTLPAGVSRILPYTYVLFLTALLVDRAGRDDRRCRAKYGADWERYCERVPYKIIPYVY